MMTPRTLTLTSDQRAGLVAARDRDRRPYFRERAATMLKIADGMAPYAVARHGGLKRRKPDTVYQWLDRYQQYGLAGLVQQPRRARGFPPQQADELRELLRQPPERFGIRRTRWRLQDLRQAMPRLATDSLPGLSRLLTRLGVRRHRGRLVLHSPDTAYHTKLAWIARAQAIARTDPDQVRLLSVDEMYLQRQPTLAPVYTPRGEEPVAQLVADSDFRQRYAGALDLVSGQVTWLTGHIVGVDRLKGLLRKLRAAYPTQRLFVVWDNWTVHQHPAVLEVASVLRIELLWLPTDAPWTNPIEKLWRWLRQEIVHHHRLADKWPTLKVQVAAFLDRFASGSPELLRYVGLSPD